MSFYLDSFAMMPWADRVYKQLQLPTQPTARVTLISTPSGTRQKEVKK